MVPAVSRLTPLLILLAAGEVRAQLVRGEVTDRVSGEPVPAASIVLLDRAREIRTTARTGSDGRFEVRTPPGSYLLRVDAYGYRPAASTELDALATDTLHFEVRLIPLPVEVEAVTVTARPRGVPDPTGFFRRREIATGHFVGPEKIEAIRPTHMPDLLRSIPGLHFYPSVGGELLWVSGRGRACSPTVYLNGGLAARGTSTMRGRPGHPEGAGLVLDAIVNPAQIGAVEVYQDGTDSPVSFRPVGPIGGGDCAVIVLWTRSGLGTKDGNPEPD